MTHRRVKMYGNVCDVQGAIHYTEATRALRVNFSLKGHVRAASSGGHAGQTEQQQVNGFEQGTI